MGRFSRIALGATAAIALAAAVGGCGVGLEGELAVFDDGGSADPNAHPSHDGHDDASLAGDDGDGGTTTGTHHDAGHGGTTTDDGGSSGDDGGQDTDDGGPQCDFSGTWATKLTIAVSWVPQGITSVILAPGTGAIEQWVLSTRRVGGDAGAGAGAPGSMPGPTSGSTPAGGVGTTDTAVVCGISLPDFSGTSIVGGETYGVRFPNTLFDGNYLPKFDIAGRLSDTTPHAGFETTETAALLGLTLQNATGAPWPATVTTSVDSDMDMHPGVTVGAATGPIPGMSGGTYSNVPVDVVKTRANQLFIVIRQVTKLTGAASDCDHLSGTVTIPQIVIPATPTTAATMKYAIDSHVIGCNLVSGGTCSSDQTGFIDGTQPVFSPSGATAFTSVRMPKGTTCADVRQSLP